MVNEMPKPLNMCSHMRSIACNSPTQKQQIVDQNELSVVAGQCEQELGNKAQS